MEYRQFITRCNGGTVGGGIADHENDIVIDWILGIGDEDYLSISVHLAGIESCIPRGIVPVIADPFGNYVCIDLRSDQHGQIYFYDHEGISLEVVSFSSQEFVARLNQD